MILKDILHLCVPVVPLAVPLLNSKFRFLPTGHTCITTNKRMKVGIIGGTGLDDPQIMSSKTEYKFDRTRITKLAGNGEHPDYGEPSGTLITGKIGGVECALLARHGRTHSANPSNVNYRANLLLLHQFGCDVIIATYSVGSLVEEYAPGHFVVMDQVIDRTQKRDLTFFDNKPTSFPGVCHSSFGEPYDIKLRQLLNELGDKMSFPVHKTGTCVAIEGPRFSSRAESVMFKQWGGHIIGMTEVPEAQLARELHIPFCAVGMVTDYDAWRVEERAVSQADINKQLSQNGKNMVQFLTRALPLISANGSSKWMERKEPGEGDMLGS